jgi:tripartite-type tricarboxylate transporter receptor subunit TctC
MAMSANINWMEQIPDQIDALMVAAEERYPSAPDVPTMKELGNDIVDCLTRGLAVPKGLPPERLAFLRKAMAEVAQDPEFAKQMKLVGLYPQWWDYQKTQSFIDTYTEENQQTFEAMQK